MPDLSPDTYTLVNFTVIKRQRAPHSVSSFQPADICYLVENIQITKNFLEFFCTLPSPGLLFLPIVKIDLCSHRSNFQPLLEGHNAIEVYFFLKKHCSMIMF